MELHVFTDGGSLNNPGPAASSYLIYKSGKLITKEAVYLGKATNNFAEYSAMTMALAKIKDLLISLRPSKIFCFSDSSLMINQINGIFKVKNKDLREFILKIRILEQEINAPIIYKHIPREKNQAADALVKNCLLNYKF